MKKLAAGLIGLVLASAPALVAQTRQSDQSADRRTNENVDANMQRAINFQHLKDAEDARQAAIEKRHPSVSEPGPNGSADRMETESMPGRPVIDQGPGPHATPPAYRTEPTREQLRQAVEWEHHKDAAAAQQANQNNRNSDRNH